MHLSHRKKSRWRIALSEVGGFFIFMGFIGKFYWMLLSGISEDVLVIVKLKRRPSTGRAVWRWKQLP